MGITVKRSSVTVTSGLLADRPAGADGDAYVATDTDEVFVKDGDTWRQTTVPRHPQSKPTGFRLDDAPISFGNEANPDDIMSIHDLFGILTEKPITFGRPSAATQGTGQVLSEITTKDGNVGSGNTEQFLRAQESGGNDDGIIVFLNPEAAIFVIDEPGQSAVLVAQSGSLWSDASGNAGTLNVFWDTGVGAFVIENNTGSSQSVTHFQLLAGGGMN